MSNNLKFYIANSGKERQQICDELGIKYSTFTDWVNGKKYPRIDNIETLAGYFGVEKSDLIEERTKKPERSVEEMWPELVPILRRKGEMATAEERRRIARIIRANFPDDEE